MLEEVIWRTTQAVGAPREGEHCLSFIEVHNQEENTLSVSARVGWIIVISVKYPQCVYTGRSRLLAYVLSQTFLTLTNFIEISTNIYAMESVYYETTFQSQSTDTNLVS